MNTEEGLLLGTMKWDKAMKEAKENSQRVRFFHPASVFLLEEWMNRKYRYILIGEIIIAEEENI